MRVAPDLSCVEKPGGERVALTRSERRVLSALARHPNRVVTRDQILDALSGPGSDRNDRSIDYLINRLRHKLSDDARNPRFIATRYGEGYVWIAPSAGADPDHAGARATAGPMQGNDTLPCSPGPAERFAEGLYGLFRSDPTPQQPPAPAPDCPPPAAYDDLMPSLSIELTYFEVLGAVTCLLSVRDCRSGRILSSRRVTIQVGNLAEAVRSAAGLERLLFGDT